MTKISEFTSRRELFLNLTLRELRTKYKRSVLGWTWSLLNPLTTMIVYSMVFGVVLRVEPPVGDPSGLHNFAMFLLCGLLPFNFLANSLNGGMASLIGNGNLVKKVWFPREILVAANTTSWLVSFLIELGVLAVVLLAFGNVAFPWLPVVLVTVAIEMVFVLGLALMLAAAAVYFRDLEHLLGILLQVWFFSAPIVYPPSLVQKELNEIDSSGWLLRIYDLNPLVRFVEAFRDLFYDLRMPPVGDLAYLVVVAAATLAGGLWVFGRLEGRLAEEL